MTVEEMEEELKSFRVEKTAEELGTALVDRASRDGISKLVKNAGPEDKNWVEIIKNRYVLQEEDYYVYGKTLEIYKKKCEKLIHIVKNLILDIISEPLFEQLDIQLENGNIDEKDLIRILSPLKRNFELAKNMYRKVNSSSTYLKKLPFNSNGKIKYTYPRTSILGDSKYCDTEIALTDKQIEEKMKMREQAIKKANNNLESSI